MLQKSSFLLLMLLFSAYAFAQTPTVDTIADVEQFPSSSFCSTATITNAGAPGYGPYAQIIVPDGLTLDSSNLFGSNITVNNVGVFPAAPGNQLLDPITGLTVTGAEGSTFYVVQPPIGSVVAGGVDLDLDLCFTIDPAAPVNVAINVQVTPVYEFGDTPTGDNGPITGASVNFDVTPVLVEFEKSNNAPEGERPPGDDWPVSYTLTANVAPNNTIENLVIEDTLPPNFVIDVGSINIAGGVGCVVNTNDPLNITCTSVTGTGGGDVVVTYSGYFDDVLNEAVCDSSNELNTATFDGDFLAAPIPQLIADSEVQLEHLSIQKSVNSANASPGQTLTFTLDIQLSEYATANSVVVVDSLPDGYTFVGNETSSLGPIAAAVATDTPGLGETQLTFDLTAIAGDITGGAPAITITYEASIDESYENPAAPILASDSLTNSVDATYSLNAGAANCSDDSSATVNIVPVSISKSVVNPLPFYKAGDVVTYRLTLEVPSGDTNGVIFQDFLPLPVFDATDVNTTYGVDVVASPLDTLGLIPSSIITDGATNSVTINWPNISTTSTQTLSVDLTVTVVDSPFADNLSLSNLLQVTTENTSVITSTAVAPVLILVRAPELHITKGVLSADQGSISPSPATLPVDGDLTDADGSDTVTFQITVENQGGAAAFDVLITDPVIPEFANCVVDSLEDGTGAPLAYSGDLLVGISLTNALAGNDGTIGMPYGADTALLNISCLVSPSIEFGSSFTNSATVAYSAIAGGPLFPTVSDTASVTVAEPELVKSIVQVLPDVDGVNNTVTVGETIQYQVVVTLPEGVGSDSQLIDLLDNGLTFLNFDSLIASPGLTTSVVGSFPQVLSNAGTLGTVNGLFDFETLTNGDSDNATIETITIQYTVLVNDVAAISDGVNRNNRVDFNTAETSIRTNAPNRTVREPNITVNKTANPIVADAGDTITYSIVVTNTNSTPAFDVVLEDLLADGDITLVVGSVTTTAGSITSGNLLGDTTVGVDIGTVTSGTPVTVTFNALLSNTVVSGDSVQNTATVTNYNSIPGGGRVYDEVDGTATVSISPAIASKVALDATSTEQSGGISNQGDVNLVDLTIGEEVTFEITATIAEGVSPQVIITDNLPNNAAGQMAYVSASVISVGANLTADIPSPVAVPVLPSSVSFDFGEISNLADGVVNQDDQIVIEVTGRVTDINANEGIEILTNVVQVQFNTGLNATAQANIEVVEPVLSIDKTSATLTADAGDVINYVINIENTLASGSSANAFDVTLTDVIPTGLAFNGNLMTDSGLVPDTLAEAGNTITATWVNYPLGSSTQISFDVVVLNTVAPEQVIQNTASIDWTSLPGTPTDDRTSSDNDPHSITIGQTGLSKIVFATSEPSTGNTVNGGEDDLTIGETATYRFTVTFPEGTTPDALVYDQLPTGSSILSVVSSQIISIGGQLTPAMGNLVGEVGTAINTDIDAYNDRVEWSFGDILNTPDGLNNTDDEIVFEVVALVVDDAVNQGGANDVVNSAGLIFTGGTLQSTAVVDFVEPDLTVTKTTLPAVVLADAGDILDYRLTIEHTAGSTADAFNLVITDLLPSPGTNWINDGTVSGSCGVTVDSSMAPTIEFTLAQFPVATGSCTIDYQVVVDIGVKPNSTYTNMVAMDYDSTPVYVAGSTRRSMDADSASFNTGVPSLEKVVTSTSLNDTGANIGDLLVDDLAIGELVDYVITITLPEGTSNNTTLLDNLPVDVSGAVMEVVSASVVSIGSNITTTLPGTPVFSNTDGDGLNDQVLFDFGNVVNSPDMVVNADDQITVIITGRITDNGLNVALETMTNDALLTYGNASNTLFDSADVELVEPNLALSKSMGAPVNGVVPIQITLSNTGGTASAYDLTLIDILDGNVWDVSTITPVTIPSGFDFSTSAGPGASDTTVTIMSAPASSPPDSSIEPNEVLVFEFSAELRDDVVLPSIVNNTVTLTEASGLPGDDAGEKDYSDLIANDSLNLSSLTATKSDALIVDNGTAGVANPSDVIRYTVVIENSGAGEATGLSFSDVPDANTSLVVGSVTTSIGSVLVGNTAGDTTVAVDVASLAAGSSVTITFDILVNNPFPLGVTEISNQGLLETNEFPPIDTDDPDTVTNDDPTVTPIGAVHDLVVTKDDAGITAGAGDTITYSIDYENAGDQNTTGVVITETIPDNTVFNAGSNPDSWVCVPNLNAGSVCTLTIGNLDGGESGTALFVVDVVSPKPTGVTEIINNISIGDDGSNGPEDDTSNNTDTENTPVDAAPDLTISKVDTNNVVSAGGTIVYILTYQNIGTQDATGVYINETVPANTVFNAGSSTATWSCPNGSPAGTLCTYMAGDVDAGVAAQTIQFAVDVPNPAPAGLDVVNNTVEIGDDGNNGPDTDPVNNTDDEDTVIDAAPDLTILKSDGDITSGPGQTVVYSLNYSNIGTQHATGVVINETVPANSSFAAGSSTPGWTCLPNINAGSACTFSIGGLNVGDSGMIEFAVLVDDPLAPGVNEISNTAIIEDDGTNGPDINPVDNDSTDTTGLLLEPPVGIKVGEFDANNPAIIHWTFYWFNPNNNRDLPVFIYDPLPANVQYIGGESCIADGTSTCTAPTFNNSLNQLELSAVLSPDFGAPANATMAQLNNEVVIKFSTRIVASGAVNIVNQALANWDEDNDGDPNNDIIDGQLPVVTDSPLTPEYGDPTVVRAVLPVPTLGLMAMLLMLSLFMYVYWHRSRQLESKD